MTAKLLLASAFLALVAVTLTACGGGGGGTDPAPAAQPPPVQGPPGPMTPIVAPSYPALELTTANAPEAVAIALRVIEEAPGVATFAVFATEVLTQTGPRTFGPCPTPRIGTSQFVHYDVEPDRAIGRGDILTAEFVPCTGTSGKLVIRPTLVDAAAQRFEARVEFSNEPTVTGDYAAGSFDLVTTFAGAPRVQTLSGLTIVRRENGEATYVTGGRIEVAATVAPQYSFSYAATVSSGRLARTYGLTTPVALRGAYSAPPSEGEIVVEGSPTRVRITPATDPAERDDMTSLAVDVAGSGQYGAATPLPWARLLGIGNLFRWHPNTRPRITRLEITPSNPNRLDTLVPSYDAIDHDGDALHLFGLWSINGVRLPQPSPTLPPGSFVRGDLIELLIQAQDNAGGVGRRSITFTIANAPPSATAAITPTAPLSVQDLAVSSTATDPDGDPLTTTYAWRIGGAPLAGQTNPTLSHTAHAKNNVVTGVVAVNDGFTTATAEASVTILDTPGFVNVPSPPTGVNYDSPISFTAVASDYDGDDTSTKDFRIVYGPAGMAVHPDTGVVSWTPRGPMFERTLRVNYGVTIDEPGAGVATGSFVVTDPNHVPPLARGGVSQPTSMHVGDFDGDGDLETLVANSGGGVYELQKAAGAGYRQTWADFTSAGGNITTDIAAEDIDGDDQAEIFLASYSRTVVQYAGADRRLARRAELPVPPTYVCMDFEVADLDGDGDSEVICLAVDSNMFPLDAIGVIVVLAADTLDVIAQLAPDVYGYHLAVANVDNDAALEIVTGSGHVFDGVAALASSSVPQWRHTRSFGWPIAAGDVDGDGIAEIIGIDGVEGIPGLNGTVRAFDARLQQRRQRWSFLSPNPGSLHVADVTGDSIAEILVGHGLIGDVAVYRQTNPTTTSKMFTVNFGDNSSIYVIATGNLDGDADVEIFISGGNDPWFAIAGGNPTPQIEWTPTVSQQPFGFLGGERLGAELAFLAATPDGDMRFVQFDTADGDLALSGGLGAYSDFDAAFAVVDYDDDGAREALLAAEDENNVQTRAIAYDLAANAVEWSATGAISEGGPTDIAYADFTGDGRDELVVLTDTGGLRVYEVGTSAPLYERPGAVAGSADVAVVNLDGIGMPEIVATMDNRVVVFSRNSTGFAITATSARFAGLMAMEITDIDGDDATDIFVLYGTESSRLARLDRFLLLRGDATLGQWATDMTTERSSFARKNLVFWRSTFTSDLFAADPISGAEVWRAPQFNGFIGPDSVRYHDLAGNGNWSISVGAGPGVTLTR